MTIRLGESKGTPRYLYIMPTKHFEDIKATSIDQERMNERTLSVSAA